METQQQNPKKQRQRRFMLMLPVLAIPFITLVFWAMGGGKAQGAGEKAQVSKGFNSTLPAASLKDDAGLDKMSYYDKAAKDTADRNSLLKSDPYYREQQMGLPNANAFGTPYFPQVGIGLNTAPYPGGGAEANEARIYQRLDQLNRALQQPETQGQTMATNPYPPYGQSGASSSDMARLQKMMEAMTATEGNADPEMDQLSGMLDKIIDIQNPGRQQEKLRQLSEQRRGQVYAVATAKKEQRISLLEEKVQPPGAVDNNKIGDNGFFSLDMPVASDSQQNAIEAVIAETQTIVSGSTVKLRLVDDIYINGKLIPKDNFLFGKASLSGERLMIEIPAVRFQKAVYPVALAVTDIDGIAGIYIPGAIARDVAKQSTDGAIQDLSFGTNMSNSIGVQAAGAGLEAAKSFFSKKVKLIKVTVKAGYRVLLMDEKQKQDN